MLQRLVFVSLAACALLPAQVDRLELGLRLRAFERHLAAATDAAARDRAMLELDRAVQAFFRLDLAGAARAVDAADVALDVAAPTPDERFARRLCVRPAARLVAAGDGEVAISVTTAYRGDGDDDAPPAGLTLVLRVDGHDGDLVRTPIGELPVTLALPLRGVPEGDHQLLWRVERDAAVVFARSAGLSVVERLDERLRALPTAGEAANEAPTIEGRTLPALVALLTNMRRDRAEETVLPGLRLLTEAEALAADPSAPFYGPDRAGDFALRVPVQGRTVAVRLYVPKRPEKPVPLVIAVHGAGGSENLFFDGYGDGEVVRLAAARGWYVASPRNGIGGLDAAALADALAERFAIDRDAVLLVGHSMGAAQVVANASRTPRRFTAMAALGGGGSVRGDFAGLPCYVGVGSRDFALAQARTLYRRLETAGAKGRLREFDGVEHLAIVQIALPEVFEFFEGALRAAK